MNYVCIACGEHGHGYEDCPQVITHQPLQTGTTEPTITPTTTPSVLNFDLMGLNNTSTVSTASSTFPDILYRINVTNININVNNISIQLPNGTTHSDSARVDLTPTPSIPEDPSAMINTNDDGKENISAPHDSRIDILIAYGNNWTDVNDKNYEKIGKQLIFFVQGYSQCDDKSFTSGGYASVAFYSRKFCECICNYVLKNKSQTKLLFLLKRIRPNQFRYPFPMNEMHKIRKKTNDDMFHDKGYNQEDPLFISYNEIKEIFEYMYKIAEWFNNNIFL
eukprot:100627_1